MVVSETALLPPDRVKSLKMKVSGSLPVPPGEMTAALTGSSSELPGDSRRGAGAGVSVGTRTGQETVIR